MNSERALHNGWRLAWGIAILVAVAASPRERSLSAQAGAQEPSATVIGMVRVVDTENRILEIITGEGHAVRLERIGVAMDCEFRVPDATPQLSSIRRGACVRISYAEAPAQAAPRLASSVEVLVFDRGGGLR